MVIVPSSAVDTMNLGGLMGMTAMTDLAQRMMDKPEAGDPEDE